MHCQDALDAPLPASQRMPPGGDEDMAEDASMEGGYDEEEGDDETEESSEDVDEEADQSPEAPPQPAQPPRSIMKTIFGRLLGRRTSEVSVNLMLTLLIYCTETTCTSCCSVLLRAPVNHCIRVLVWNVHVGRCGWEHFEVFPTVIHISWLLRSPAPANPATWGLQLVQPLVQTQLWSRPQVLRYTLSTPQSSFWVQCLLDF